MARVLVVGAGITGLSAAVLLARHGLEVEVWEAAAEPGGLLAPVRFRGLECDRGSHRVHPEAHPLVLELTRDEGWQERPRRGELLLRGRRLPYPPDPLRFLRALGVRATVQLSAGFLLRPGALGRALRWEQERAALVDEGFERFVRARVGGAAYRAFYRPYAEKVWGEPPHTLSQSVAKRRVSTTSPLRALRAAAGGRGGGATFLYPRRGMAGLVRRLRQLADESGARVRHGRAATLPALREAPHEHILFSGHLSDLVPRSGLEHRGLYLVHLAVPHDAVGEADTWYAPEARHWFGRVSRLDGFSQAYERPGERVLCLEIPEGRWGAGRDFLAHVDILRSQLEAAGILRPGAPVLDATQTWVPRVYPLYRVGWREVWRRALDELVATDPRILPIGRQGLFLHCNIDHCVKIASDAVEHVVGGGTGAQWAERAEAYHGLRVRD